MDHDHNKPADLDGNTVGFRAEDLCDAEVYFRKEGCSQFEYDSELDIFRFTEDGRFAFCQEFADWRLLGERGYLDF